MDPRARRFNPARAGLVRVNLREEYATVRRLLPELAAELRRIGPAQPARYRRAHRQYRVLQERERDLSARCGDPPLVPADRAAVFTWPRLW